MVIKSVFILHAVFVGLPLGPHERRSSLLARTLQSRAGRNRPGLVRAALLESAIWRRHSHRAL